MSAGAEATLAKAVVVDCLRCLRPILITGVVVYPMAAWSWDESATATARDEVARRAASLAPLFDPQTLGSGAARSDVGPFAYGLQPGEPVRTLDRIFDPQHQADAVLVSRARLEERLGLNTTSNPNASQTDLLAGHGFEPSSAPAMAFWQPWRPVARALGPDDIILAQAGSDEGGGFEVDEEAAADRALERSLVEEGALLLPLGQFELVPSFVFATTKDDAPIFLIDGDVELLASDEAQTDTIEAELALRMGMPFDSQIEVSLPYVFQSQELVSSVGFTEVAATTTDIEGFGDVRVMLSKTLLREDLWMPNLIGNIIWDSNSGETEEGQSLGSGFNELGVSLSAVRRHDPLVFVGGLSADFPFEENDIEPGFTLGLSLGTVLAASPSTSLRFSVDYSFTDEVEVDGMQIDGSDRQAATLNLGVSTILGRRALLDLGVEVGATEDANDFAFTVALPVRFGMPR
ncbi:MAG: hypothetical protein ACFB6S_10445 [Geminicoccaceae bacterium]